MSKQVWKHPEKYWIKLICREHIQNVHWKVTKRLIQMLLFKLFWENSEPFYQLQIVSHENYLPNSSDMSGFWSSEERGLSSIETYSFMGTLITELKYTHCIFIGKQCTQLCKCYLHCRKHIV